MRPAPAPPPIRLRYLLFLGAIALLGSQAVPMALAAWKLRDTATAFANYALCMVGPTGPAALRDNPSEFWTLVRRRIVSSPAGSHPFEKCAAGATLLTDSEAVRKAHRARAWDFVEYAGAATRSGKATDSEQLRVSSLEVTRAKLVDLAGKSGPFAREGYASLVVPSTAASEAQYPAELSKPSLGQGLPNVGAMARTVVHEDGAWLLSFGNGANATAFRSSDGGRRWHPTDPGAIREEYRGACGAGNVSYKFVPSDDGKLLLVESHRQGVLRYSAPVASVEQELWRVACDERAVVVATRREGSSDVNLVSCPHSERCRSMPMPRYEGVDEKPTAPLDIARVAGTTVVSTVQRGIVRVSSSRDEGHSWAPLTVAFDEAQSPVPARSEPPWHLLVVGNRVILHGFSTEMRRGGGTYAFLVSDDGGASFRGLPEAPPTRATATAVR